MTNTILIAVLMMLAALIGYAMGLHAYHSGRSGQDPIPSIPNPLKHKENGEPTKEPAVIPRSRV